MRVTTVRIRNFRGIRELDLDLGEITVLVGENNSGKTAVLDLLRICLRDLGPRRRVVFEALDFHLADAAADPASADPIEIEITFSEQTTGDWTDELIGRLNRDNVLQVDDEGRSHVMLRVTCAYDPESRDFDPGAGGAGGPSSSVGGASVVGSRKELHRPETDFHPQR